MKRRNTKDKGWIPKNTDAVAATLTATTAASVVWVGRNTMIYLDTLSYILTD